MCDKKGNFIRFLSAPSRAGLFELFDNARNSYLILTLGWIAISCGFTSASSAQYIELDEVLSIEGFFEVTDITVGRDGSIYVADRRDFSISKFDTQGRLIRRFGSQGVAPGEFVNGPRSIALLDSVLVATDLKGTGVMHFFDLDLNYEGSARVRLPLDMDSAPNELLYFESTDLTDLTMVKRYISTYVPHGEPSRIFELKDMHEFNIERLFSYYCEKLICSRFGVQVESTQMEVNCIDESVFVAESACADFDRLDPTVDAFSRAIADL